MLVYPVATAAILLLGGADAATPKQRAEFMRAMKASTKNAKRTRKLNADTPKEFKAALYGNSKESSSLRKKFMSKAKAVSPGEARKLEDAADANNYNGNNYANNNWNQYQKQNYKDGSDDYFAINGDWENEFGFDVSQYSLSYHRCAAVKQYDDEVAAREDTLDVFATKNFAVFRFCPEQTCMGYYEEEDEYTQYLEAKAEWEAENNGYDYDEEQNSYEPWRNAEFRDGKWYTYTGGVCEEDDFDENGDCRNEMFYGARGEGCSANYGEYMIELEDYLQLMLEYQEEHFQTYCQYCEECMFEVYQIWLQNGGQQRKLTYEEFKGSEKHQKAARELGGNLNGGQANGKYYNVCPEYDTCAEYQYTCKQGMDMGLSDYFECTEVQRNNGQVAYIGPHCASNGFTVTLGVFSDEYCNNYIGDGVDIANFLGQELNIEEDDLKSYYNSANGVLDLLEFSNEDDVCIPCRLADNPYQDSEWVAQNDDQAEAQYNTEEFEINEICSNLYLVSARCDKHYRSYNKKSKQAGYAEAVAQEDLSCDFIDSVVMGNYNEIGEISVGDDYQIEAKSGMFKDNMYAEQYGHYISEVTPLQIFGLLASIAAVGILAVWSMSLHASLSKRGPWRPRRGLNNEPASPDVARQNSGIVMGRSQSNTSYYMS